MAKFENNLVVSDQPVPAPPAANADLQNMFVDQQYSGINQFGELIMTDGSKRRFTNYAPKIQFTGNKITDGSTVSQQRQPETVEELMRETQALRQQVQLL